MFVLKATIELGVNCEPGLYSSGQGKMESVVYLSEGFPQGAYIRYRIFIKLLALYLKIFSLISGLKLKRQARYPHSSQNKPKL